jgi:hypothetical protein
MGESEWRLTATATTLLALALTGFQIVRSVWLGRAVRVRRYRSILMVEVVAGLLLAWPTDRADELVVAGTMVASAIETQPCGPASVTAFRLHGERVHVAGSGRPAPACGIWAVAEDARSGSLWLQGPAVVGQAGWELDLVLGTGDTSGDSLLYRVSLVVVAAPTDEAWTGMAREQNAIRLPERPTDASWLIRDHPFERRRGADTLAAGEFR